ncbi:MAG TPA: proprotein convertase P-domain-containing protein, partial [Bacteroidia bacterium]|nr:proprotein convertase P-domain-containing protein [Bacteroidia bacterium]
MKLKLLLFLIVSFLCFNKHSNAQTFSGTTGAVPDLATTCFTANVVGLPGVLTPTNGLITCCINLTHTYDADLTMVLTAPSGASIQLTSNNGGAGDNYITTCFDGNAATSITTGTAPFNGSYRP